MSSTVGKRELETVRNHGNDNVTTLVENRTWNEPNVARADWVLRASIRLDNVHPKDGRQLLTCEIGYMDKPYVTEYSHWIDFSNSRVQVTDEMFSLVVWYALEVFEKWAHEYTTPVVSAIRFELFDENDIRIMKQQLGEAVEYRTYRHFGLMSYVTEKTNIGRKLKAVKTAAGTVLDGMISAYVHLPTSRYVIFTPNRK